jgi:hypothetical protein
VDDWLVTQGTYLGIPFQNWMVVSLALVLAAVLIAVWERN